ncbi:MAG: hypothetical protein IPG48_03410 [Saprospiraceae bacterium]|nr:hypothetical protein [Saprospiraceae bacterium]
MKHISTILLFFICTFAHAQNIGINNTDPMAALDLKGDLRLRSETLTSVVTGLNNDVNLNTTKSSIYMFDALLVGIQISGFDGGGTDGRIITIFNNTNGAVQLYNDYSTSLAANRIFTGTGNTAVIYQNGSVTLRYDGAIQRWTIISSNYTDGLGLSGGGSGPWTVTGNDINNNNTGKVGIGVPVPMSKLDVANAANNEVTLTSKATGTNSIAVYGINENGGVGVLGEAYSNNSVGGSFITFGNGKAMKAETVNGGTAGHFSAPNGNAIITDQGNVGIGVPLPEEKLHVDNGNIRLGNSIWTSAANNRLLKFGDGDYATIGEVGEDNLQLFAGQITLEVDQIFGSSGNVLIPLGNVGIGTTNPSHKLSVNGIIRSKEILVEATPWPDYVFSDEYNLQSISDVEKYIYENNHLPNFPKAKDIETNGQAVGEIQRKMMEKIEELTLYIIELNKRIVELEKDIR